jgi:hypothetical protein
MTIVFVFAIAAGAVPFLAGDVDVGGVEGALDVGPRRRDEPLE